MKKALFPLLLSLVILLGGAAFFIFNTPLEKGPTPSHPPKILKKNSPEKKPLESKEKKVKKTPDPKKVSPPKATKKIPPKKKVQTFFVDGKNKTIRVKGYVVLQKGLIEVFVCSPKGKRHEAVFVILCDPKALQFTLLAFGLKPNRKLKTFGEGRTLSGDKVYIYARWKDSKTNKDVLYRAEDLVYNIRTQRTMKRVGWVFTGSRFQKYQYKTEEGEAKEKEVFMASYAGNLVATYHDPDCILNNPLETGGDDTVYYSNYLALPPRGHPAELIFTLKENPEWDKISQPYDYNKIKKAKKGTTAPKKADEKKADEKKADEKKPDEKKPDEKKPDEKKK